MTPNILSKEIFCKEVEKFVLSTGASYMEAIVELCDKREIEVEVAAKLLTPHVKSIIEKEAMDLNMVQKRSTLSFD